MHFSLIIIFFKIIKKNDAKNSALVWKVINL
jgi:hypothetical protein